MIKYALKCNDGHSFESWFASAQAYDGLKAAGHIVCVVCGSSDVTKAIMAPRVSTARAKSTPAAEDIAPVTDQAAPPQSSSRPPSAPSPEQLERALSAMRADVEKNATYVGGAFAKEARAQHLGDVPDRPIYGEANAAEAKALIEDGIPVAPLPFVPTRKAN